MQNLAVDYGPDGITANAVAPGVIETPQALDPVNSLGPEGVAAVAPKVPLRHGSDSRRTSRISTRSLPARSRNT